jgi:hypothetical protein
MHEGYREEKGRSKSKRVNTSAMIKGNIIDSTMGTGSLSNKAVKASPYWGGS